MERTILRISILLLLSTIGVSASSQPLYAQDCDALKPQQAVNSEVSDEVKASGSTRFKIASGEFDNQYRKIQKDVLSKYPRADTLSIWKSFIYYQCTLLQKSRFSDVEKQKQFEWLFKHADRRYPRTAVSFPTAATNSIGNASNNTGIITQGQTGGQNTIIQAPKKHVRHLAAADKEMLIRIFTPLAPTFPELKIGAPMDGEARGYAKEFADVFNQIGIKVPHIYIVFPTSAEEEGGMGVFVKDIHNWPPLADTFLTAMREAGFPVKPGILETAADGDFQFVIF
jgi:hypothetical protein